MHTVHLLAVTAADEGAAIERVQQFLAEHPDVTDWASIGGRWGGLLDGRDLLCGGETTLDGTGESGTTNPLAAINFYVERALDWRRESWDAARLQLAGPDPAAFASDDADTRRRAAWQAAQAARFRQLLTSPTPPGGPASTDVELLTLDATLIRFVALATDRFSVASGYWDAVEHTGDPQYLYDRLADDPEGQWLVVADLHH
jgi:hypothetical protein